jgi:hypothetical protein
MVKHNLWSDQLLEEVPTHWEKHNDLALFPETTFKSEEWFDPRFEFYVQSNQLVEIKTFQ